MSGIAAIARSSEHGQHTILLVQQHFHLFDVTILQCIAYLALRIRGCQIAVHEIARGTLIHQICPQITGELGEAIVGVDERIVHDLSIG